MTKYDKVCCFAGHRFEWHSVGIDEKLYATIEDLINKGYTIFYDGAMGAFDAKCAKCILSLKPKYPHIKLIKVLTYYHHEKDKWEIPTCYDGSIFPDIEEVHYKQKILKRNQWIVDNSDIVVCHIQNTENSGAYKTVQYANNIGKPVIYL